MKKGALELSITAIVVLIIAITVLGFAIFFIKSLFTTGQEILEGEITKVKDKLKDDFASEGKSIGINVGTDIRLESGKPKQLFIGVKNAESRRVCYGIIVKCLGSTGEVSCEDIQSTEPGAVGGIGADDTSNIWFKKLFAALPVEPNDVAVLPTTVQVPTKFGKETFQMRLEVSKEVTEADSPTLAEVGACDPDDLAPIDDPGVGEGELYSTLPFFITVE